MQYIVIRKSNPNDTPSISEVVRYAYISNTKHSWLNAVFNEITFQLVVFIFALLFICFHVRLFYCFFSIPIVLILLYVLIYGNLTMKAAEVMYNKRPLECWVAETYEKLFSNAEPSKTRYKIITEEDMAHEDLKPEGKRKIIGTIAVMNHKQKDDWAWLFRLAVDERYRRKGIASHLIETVKDWCKEHQYNNLEVAISECQQGSRELFDRTGFEIKQLYHKKLFTSAVMLQMFQLRCSVRPTFN